MYFPRYEMQSVRLAKLEQMKLENETNKDISTYEVEMSETKPAKSVRAHSFEHDWDGKWLQQFLDRTGRNKHFSIETARGSFDYLMFCLSIEICPLIIYVLSSCFKLIVTTEITSQSSPYLVDWTLVPFSLSCTDWLLEVYFSLCFDLFWFFIFFIVSRFGDREWSCFQHDQSVIEAFLSWKLLTKNYTIMFSLDKHIYFYFL